MEIAQKDPESGGEVVKLWKGDTTSVLTALLPQLWEVCKAVIKQGVLLLLLSM